MKQIKFGIWGYGRMGEKHGRFYAMEKEKFQMVAACDTDEKKLASAKNEYPDSATYNDGIAFLGDPNMELVVISTLSTDHMRHAVQALESGRYVLLDKPIALTNQELEKLQSADRQFPGKLFILHNLRFEPGVAELPKIIESGVLGAIHMIKIRRHHNLWGFFRSDWQTMIAAGGGILGNWGNHDIDHAVQLLGTYPVNIWSRLWHLTAGGDGDDHAKIIFTGADGRVLDLELSYNVTLPEPYCTVYGCRGSLICPSPWIKEYRLKYLAPEFKMPEISVDENPSSYKSNTFAIPWVEETRKIDFSGDVVEYIDRELIRHLYEAIRNRIPFPIKNADAFETVRIMQEIRKQNPQFNWLR